MSWQIPNVAEPFDVYRKKLNSHVIYFKLSCRIGVIFIIFYCVMCFLFIHFVRHPSGPSKQLDGSRGIYFKFAGYISLDCGVASCPFLLCAIKHLSDGFL